MSEMRKIALQNGYFTVVDNEDFELLSQYKWTLGVGGYSSAHIPKKDDSYKGRFAINKRRYKDKVYLYKKAYMHWMVLPNNTGLTDHINGNTLDNRKQNLRPATHQQNMANRKIQKNNTSGFKGVTPFKNKWRAKTRVNGADVHIGIFGTKEEAAQAYNNFAVANFKTFARLNYI